MAKCVPKVMRWRDWFSECDVRASVVAESVEGAFEVWKLDAEPVAVKELGLYVC